MRRGAVSSNLKRDAVQRRNNQEPPCTILEPDRRIHHLLRRDARERAPLARRLLRRRFHALPRGRSPIDGAQISSRLAGCGEEYDEDLLWHLDRIDQIGGNARRHVRPPQRRRGQRRLRDGHRASWPRTPSSPRRAAAASSPGYDVTATVDDRHLDLHQRRTRRPRRAAANVGRAAPPPRTAPASPRSSPAEASASRRRRRSSASG